MSIETRYIQQRDIESVSLLPPVDWNFDFRKYWLQHKGHSYFHCLVATDGTRVTGMGCATINGDTAWLGLIIVHPEYRRMGIGRMITQRLIEIAEEKDCNAIVLIATSSGEKLYTTLGFEQSHVYKFYRGPVLSPVMDPAIRPLSDEDIPDVMTIDHIASGEHRRILLKNFLKGYVFEEAGKVKGYFLPEFGEGLIVALDHDTGIRLARLKLSMHGKIVVPEGNHPMHEWIKKFSVEQHLSAPRMFLKKDVAFKPEMILARGAGYFG